MEILSVPLVDGEFLTPFIDKITESPSERSASIPPDMVIASCSALLSNEQTAF